MDNFFTRFRAEVVLAAILFVQVIALATQVRTPTVTGGGESAPLIRVWAVALISPFQKAAVNSGGFVRGLWHEYADLRNVRRENEALRDQLDQVRIAQIRMEQDAAQGRRLQSLLAFKEQFIARTIAAQVIGTSGTDLARVIYVDRGQLDGVQQGMAVITPDGVVGKVLRADKSVSQVLLITDPTSGAGVLLERQRLNGILRGGGGGAYPEVLNVMGDEKIEVGDRVITTGGDRVFPKGLPVGTVISVALDKGRDPFLAIRVKPAVNLSKLEEVLIVTQLPERLPEPVDATGPARAADMLAQRLPSVKKKEVPAQSAGESGEGPPPDTSISTPPGPDPQKKASPQKPAATSKKDGPR